MKMPPTIPPTSIHRILGYSAFELMPLFRAAGIDSDAPVVRRLRPVRGSNLVAGRLLAGEPAYLGRRDAEQLFEVSGELVGASVAVCGDDVLDGRHGQRRILQTTVAFLQA